MRTTVTLTPEQAVKAGAVVELGSVNQEDETWVNGAYEGASSFANRTRYAIEPDGLKAGLNVIVTNVYCGWRDCGLRGPADNRAVRFADNTRVPLSNPWTYQEVADGAIGPRLPWGSVHGMTLRYNGMGRAARLFHVSRCRVVPGRVRRALRGQLLQVDAARDDG